VGGEQADMTGDRDEDGVAGVRVLLEEAEEVRSASSKIAKA